MKVFFFVFYMWYLYSMNNLKQIFVNLVKSRFDPSISDRYTELIIEFKGAAFTGNDHDRILDQCLRELQPGYEDREEVLDGVRFLTE